MFGSIGEWTLFIFAACNVITIPMVWALYPESNQRTLEEMNLLFAADSPWNWEAEKNYAILKAENPDLVRAAARGKSVSGASGVDVETEGEKRRSSLATGAQRRTSQGATNGEKGGLAHHD